MRSLKVINNCCIKQTEYMWDPFEVLYVFGLQPNLTRSQIVLHDFLLLPHKTKATSPQPIPFLGNENTGKIKGQYIDEIINYSCFIYEN